MHLSIFAKRRGNQLKKIYFDNAATTFPKPPEVLAAINRYFTTIGASPGRSGYKLGLDADRELFKCREDLANFFNCGITANVIFTMNITYAINMILWGVLNAGDHLITSSMEHNSVARPLEALKQSKLITYTVIKADTSGFVNPLDIRKAITPKTKMIVLNHASNVFGTIQNAEEIGKIAQENGLLYLLDTAQTAGVIPIDMKKFNISFLAFTGHKSLLGPPGIGGICINQESIRHIRPLIYGGTGSMSHLLEQPEGLPDRLESGTLNTPGIMGLNAGIEFINTIGIDTIHKHETELLNMFVDGCKEFSQINIYPLKKPNKQTACVSINLENLDGGQLSYVLDQAYGIMTRSGLHCSPWAHQTIGTFPEGTVRFSFGWYNTKEEIAFALNALKEIIYD